MHGQEFELVNYTFCWGEARVAYYDAEGTLCTLPAAWTDVGQIDPLIELGQGRCDFRIDDLLELANLVRNAIRL